MSTFIDRQAYLHILNKQNPTPVIPAIKEKDIVKQILQYLRLLGHTAGKIKSHGIYDAKRKTFRIDRDLFTGLPDILCFTKEGKMIFFEVKSAKGIQSEQQKNFEELCLKSGVSYRLVRDVQEVQLI